MQTESKGLVAFQRFWSLVGEGALCLCPTLGKRQRRQGTANSAAVSQEAAIKICTHPTGV